MVGAGNAPGCFDEMAARARLGFSNFGARIDAQGWGNCVTTSGYGWLQGGDDPNLWYTAGFNGTSSASPIVAAGAALLSSIAEERGTTLTPAGVRAILAATGREQPPGDVGRIGPLPDLRAAIPTLPGAATGDASAVSHDAAQLGGTVTPHGIATSYRFDYGPTSDYGSSTAPTDAGSGSTPIAATAALSGLEAATTYHYRLVAVRSGRVTATSADRTFTTNPLPPSVTPDEASGVTQTAATLRGQVDPNGTVTAYRFEYGTSDAYGSTTTVADAGAGQAPVAVSAGVASLAPATTYHYRLVALRAGQVIVAGEDRAFTTLALPPSVSSGAASGVLQTAATLHGSLAPNGTVTAYRFEYGTTPGYGSNTGLVDAGAGSAAVAVSAAIDGLSPATTYHYRLVAVRSGEVVAVGDDQAFTTPALLPSVSSGDASAVSPSAATVAGEVRPNGAATAYRFEYGTTASYGSNTAAIDAGAGPGVVAVSAGVDGLSPATTYHYRLVAIRSGAVAAVGADRTFTTPALPQMPVIGVPLPPVAVAGEKRKRSVIDRVVPAGRVRNGRVALSLRCSAPAGATCSGGISLGTKVGAASFRIRGGRRSAITVKLTRAVLATLARRRRLPVKATVTNVQADGSRVISKATFELSSGPAR